VLAQQYADDRNLAARQRLWQMSRSEPEFDLNRWSVELLEVSDGAVVLDAGCGNGGPLSLLRRLGCTAVGLDASFGMLRTAGAPPAAVGDVQALPFITDGFDAAAVFMILYHVPDRPSAAAELRRVVRRGGLVVATTASNDNQPELLDMVEDAVGGGWVWTRPSESSFSLERGADVLGSAFDSVEVVRAPERQIFVTDAAAMAAYVASIEDHYVDSLPPGRAWSAVVDAVRDATSEAIQDHGALTLTARVGALVCR
jgi:SAM-dependent methyltransferase